MNKKFYNFGFAIVLFAALTGCAAGSATAAYSVKAQTADNLTSDAEQRIVDRAKREALAEMNRQQEFSRSQSTLTPVVR